ncbi:MAG: DUF2293 domain-containing protein [Hyphomicrobiales bacterium]|nr:DUF2293 domain-containing protein [Hyphomicrobiales bacterium]
MASRADIENAIRTLAPRIPKHELGAVADLAKDSVGLKPASAETAAWLALTSYVRHALTDYDALLADGYDQDSARHFVLDDMNRVLAAWGVRRRIGSD